MSIMTKDIAVICAYCGYEEGFDTGKITVVTVAGLGALCVKCGKPLDGELLKLFFS